MGVPPIRAKNYRQPIRPAEPGPLPQPPLPPRPAQESSSLGERLLALLAEDLDQIDRALGGLADLGIGPPSEIEKIRIQIRALRLLRETLVTE